MTRTLLLALTLLAAPAWAAPASRGPAPGEAAPDFEAPDREGAAHRLQEWRGQAVLLNFWASWCAPCLAELPRLEAIRAAVEGQGATVLLVNVDTDRAAALRTLERRGPAPPSLFDPEGRIVGTWDPPAMPSSWLIDPQGVVRERIIGEIGASEVAEVQARLAALAAPPPVEAPAAALPAPEEASDAAPEAAAPEAAAVEAAAPEAAAAEPAAPEAAAVEPAAEAP